MSLCIVETVQLELLGLPALVILVAKQHAPGYCTADVFIVPAESTNDPVFGRSIAIQRAPVDEELAIAVAREIARTELSDRLLTLPVEDRCGSFDFIPVDEIRLRALRCLGKYAQLAGLSGRSNDFHDELRAFVQSVSGVEARVVPL